MVESRLAAAGVPDPRRDAVVLIAHVLGRDNVYLVARPDAQISPSDEEKLIDLTDRRSAREPLQYIVGRQEFFGMEFKVAPGVLIPRPETEILVERVIEILRRRPAPTFCEVGIGSGCISIAILANVETASAIATDISPAAMRIAQENAVTHRVIDRLWMIAADVLTGVEGRTFDMVVSNPPYVPEAVLATLQAEVRDFEPRLALAGGDDGLTVIRRVIDEAARNLTAGGHLLLEVGFDQGARVTAMFDASAWASFEFLPDLQGIPRIALAETWRN